ncbi:protein with signal peptide plus 12 transmembrane domain protein [Cryptosporidium ryanae]|uniref:protein with signal peptide plus 12 transmembrane domain protein n=1 Tax=Cryptosporidium ryanae TaxID=515981 RepID=UPI00351AB087|nr:protein with signal peptide plus 12 transmembrane domain protein [Cryptosporidium ryanae]
MIPLLSRIKTLIGGFSLNIILAMLHSMSNVSMYVASYMMFSKPFFLGKEYVSLSDLSWVYTLNVALIGVTLPFGGYINRRLGIRASLYITTMIITISTFSAYYLVSSYYLFTIVFGCLIGIADGISFNIPQYCAYKCWPESKGTASSIVASGLALSPIIFSPMQTMIANPNNLSPNFKMGNSLYFSQEEVLQRVPKMFIAMGTLVFVLSTIALLTLLDPGKESSQLSNVDKGIADNEESVFEIKFEPEDHKIKQICKSKNKVKSALLDEIEEKIIQVDNNVSSECKKYYNQNPFSNFSTEISNTIYEKHNQNNATNTYMPSLLCSKNIVFNDNMNSVKDNKLGYMKFHMDIVETNSEKDNYFPLSTTFSPYKYRYESADKTCEKQVNNNVKVNVNSLNICPDNNFSCSGSDICNYKQEKNGLTKFKTSIKEYIYKLLNNYPECDNQNKNNLNEIFITISLLKEKQFWLIFWQLFFFTQYVHFVTSWWKNIGIINLNISDDTLATFGTIVTSLCNIFGRFFFGSLLDKFKGRFCFILISSSCLITMTLFQLVINISSEKIYLLSICVMFFNFGAGFVIFPPIVATHFGVKYYTFIYGIVYIGRSFGVLVNSSLTSFILKNFSIEFCSIIMLILTWFLFLLSLKFKDNFEFSDHRLKRVLFS